MQSIWKISYRIRNLLKQKVYTDHDDIDSTYFKSSTLMSCV